MKITRYRTVCCLLYDTAAVKNVTHRNKLELERKGKSKQVFADFCTIRGVAELMLVEKKKENPVPEIGNRTQEKLGPFPSID